MIAYNKLQKLDLKFCVLPAGVMSCLRSCVTKLRNMGEGEQTPQCHGR